ncbi:TRAP transporter substrate-binding protein [Alloalcanivorax sp. C16-2]|uniref:TRAP transporter substrate-binding protein n=1 Tax=Alloalcanivorax TaxID=3020832 RepID=UPI001934A77D|nr:TRAP transporter substrate-binding protein [Alloalcanivorax marinus]MBL7249372.1 TRAP transporter substrate-binding protein [Alloalcanivorax marinus]
MKRIHAGVLLIALMALFPLAAQAKTLRLGLITPPSHQWTLSAQAMAKQVREESNGELDILVFPSGQLGSEAQMVQMMQRGALDMAFLAAGELANREPDFAALFAPYLVETPQQARELLQGDSARKLLAEGRRLGLVGLGFGMAGLRQIVVRGEVNSIDDLAGRKIRTMPVQPERDFWNKIGAAPTPIPLPALYDAFANGQVDGMQIDFEGTWNTRYLDYAGTVIQSNHMMLPMIAVASARTWKGLSEDERALLNKRVGAHLDALFDTYADIDARYLAKIRNESDVPVITVGRDFFGNGVDLWYREWREKAPLLKALEKEAAAIRGEQ